MLLFLLLLLLPPLLLSLLVLLDRMPIRIYDLYQLIESLFLLPGITGVKKRNICSPPTWLVICPHHSTFVCTMSNNMDTQLTNENSGKG